MKNVLLTGGAGFIGSHVADLLLEENCNVTVYDNLSFGKENNIPCGCSFVKGDITDRESVSSLYSNNKFDTVIHLAAIHFIPFCNQHPDLACRTNVEGTQNIFDGALNSGSVEKLFTASTAAVYPDMPYAIPESTPKGPMDVYGMTKSANEEQAAIFSRRSGAKVCIGRFFNAVGGRETNPHLVPDILKRIANSSTIEIGNTTPKRDYIDVRDMASGVIDYLIGAVDAIDTCNIGTGLVFDVEEITALIAEIHGKPITLNASERLIRKVERQNLQADNSRLKSKYGWAPKYSVKNSMEYAYEWFASEK